MKDPQEDTMISSIVDEETMRKRILAQLVHDTHTTETLSMDVEAYGDTALLDLHRLLSKMSEEGVVHKAGRLTMTIRNRKRSTCSTAGHFPTSRLRFGIGSQASSSGVDHITANKAAAESENKSGIRLRIPLLHFSFTEIAA